MGKEKLLKLDNFSFYNNDVCPPMGMYFNFILG